MKRCQTLLSVLGATIGLVCFGAGTASALSLYVDAAPNKFGSPDYDPWEASSFAAAIDGSFVNMANSFDPANVGTTDFEIQDEVVYSFGDLGKRLTWIYWVPNTTIADLTGNFEISLFNCWGTDPELDFYDYYYGSTWLEPTSWVEQGGGVIGTAGMAWWGGYDTNTQEELDADIAAWGAVPEKWEFKVRLDGTESSITSYRDWPPEVPEPSSVLLLGLLLAGGPGVQAIRRRRRA